MNKSFKPYFYLFDQNVDKWTEIKKNKIKNNSKSFKNFIKNINYNLSFQCDMLIIENNIDYFDKNEQEKIDDNKDCNNYHDIFDDDDDDDDDENELSNIITNYTLSTPLTIDLLIQIQFYNMSIN